MKEDRKPLTYITNGIVAMNFCWRDKEKQWINDEERLLLCWLSITGIVATMNMKMVLMICYLGQTQSVDEIHWDVGLRQVDY